MPRRQPPTPLRLHVGPLPPRGKPKHTMPSLPRPAFHALPSVTAAAGPVPRARMSHTDLPALAIPAADQPPTAFTGGFSATALTGMGFEGGWSGPSSPTSAESTRSTRSVGERREIVRGPWDHSGAIRVPFDVEAVLPPPMRAAVSVRGMEEGAKKRPW